MISRRTIISAKQGLHIREAGILANAAEQCGSTVELVVGSSIVNCRSILNIVSMALPEGAEVELRCSGAAEEKDLQFMLDVIEHRMNEKDGEEK